MAIYECRIMFKASSPVQHHSSNRNPVGTNLCAGYSFWTPSAQGGGASLNNGNSADHRHVMGGVDTFSVVVYDVSNTITAGAPVTGEIAFRSIYIGSAAQNPFTNISANLVGTFQAGSTASPYPFAYLIPAAGWLVTNAGSFDFSVQFTVAEQTYFIDPEMDVDPGGGQPLP